MAKREPTWSGLTRLPTWAEWLSARMAQEFMVSAAMPMPEQEKLLDQHDLLDEAIERVRGLDVQASKAMCGAVTTALMRLTPYRLKEAEPWHTDAVMAAKAALSSPGVTAAQVVAVIGHAIEKGTP